MFTSYILIVNVVLAVVLEEGHDIRGEGRVIVREVPAPGGDTLEVVLQHELQSHHVVLHQF